MILKKFIGIAALLSSIAMATTLPPPIEGVSVTSTENSVLSIQNLSNQKVKVKVYGDEFYLEAVSGLVVNCKGHENLELILDDNIYDYFEVPCKSRVIVSKFF